MQIVRLTNSFQVQSHRASFRVVSHHHNCMCRMSLPIVILTPAKCQVDRRPEAKRIRFDWRSFECIQISIVALWQIHGESKISEELNGLCLHRNEIFYLKKHQNNIQRLTSLRNRFNQMLKSKWCRRLRHTVKENKNSSEMIHESFDCWSVPHFVWQWSGIRSAFRFIGAHNDAVMFGTIWLFVAGTRMYLYRSMCESMILSRFAELCAYATPYVCE